VVQAQLGRKRGIYVQDENKERWRLLCEQASIEPDSKKLHELIKEISRLLDERNNRLKGSAKCPTLNCASTDVPLETKKNFGPPNPSFQIQLGEGGVAEAPS
jgi:hypothetical protein